MRVIVGPSEDNKWSKSTTKLLVKWTWTYTVTTSHDDQFHSIIS